MKEQQQQVTLRRLTPDIEGNWLYHDDEGGNRMFATQVYLGVNASLNDWHECTNDEKEQWEKEHPVEDNINL